jgi:alkylation response protein AidB-like acyl-CoA dehydrogenase
MDFSFSSDQEALRDLTRQILSATCTNDHLKTVRNNYTDAIDADLWKQLADSGLVGIGLPESAEGGGLGFLEIALVLSECARAAAPVHALASLIGGYTVATYGDADDLAGVASGDAIITFAVHEQVGDVYAPFTSASGDAVTGEKVVVPAGTVAKAFVVSTAEGLYLVDATASGVTVERQDSNNGIPLARVTFAGAPGKKLTGPEGVAWLNDHIAAAVSVMTAAACETVLALTAEYVKGRVQFERPLATFQAVSQRTADAYIDTEAVKLTAWQAAWRLSEGLPATEHVASAKFWASDGGFRVIHAAHHLHGGMGVDRDYPLHRFNFNLKQWEVYIGSATPSLLRLGRELAAS